METVSQRRQFNF